MTAIAVLAARIPAGLNPGGVRVIARCCSGETVTTRDLDESSLDTPTPDGLADRYRSRLHMRGHGCCHVAAACYDGTTGEMLGAAELPTNGLRRG